MNNALGMSNYAWPAVTTAQLIVALKDRATDIRKQLDAVGLLEEELAAIEAAIWTYEECVKNPTEADGRQR